MKTDLSIIVAFLNEKDNIERLVAELDNYLAEFNSIKPEVIYVDDGSTDGSTQILKRLTHSRPNVKIIKLSKNFGSHAAIRAGLLHSSGEFVTFLSADLQDPLDLIEKLYAKCKEGYDIVFAFRNAIKCGIMEKFFSRLYAGLMRLFVYKDFPKKGFDVVMFNRKIREELNQNIESNSSIFLQILTLGFKQAFISYNKNARLKGKSKWPLTKKLKMVADSFVAFSYVPIRFISAIGIILSLFGFIWICYIVARAIFIKDLNPGWPSLIAILLLGFGISNISLGIIAEYLWRTLEASRKRQVFIIDEITCCDNEKKA